MKNKSRIAILVIAFGCSGKLSFNAGESDAGDGPSRNDGNGGCNGCSDNDAGNTPVGGPSGPYFPNGSWIYRDVSEAPLDPKSSDIISWLDNEGGWGNDNRLWIDFTLTVMAADNDVPMRQFEETEDFWNPDCDKEAVPVPPGGAIEGNPGYECENDGDCHLIVVHNGKKKLYEMWRANISGGTFYGGCLAVWDMNKVYDNDGRGQGCSSADAAGFPIAPLLFTADEIAAGEIAHAIRFALPNERIRANKYVAPSTHSTSATSGGDDAPPYGAWLRLRADYPIDSLPSPGAKTLARAMQKYGMLLSDGGQIGLMGADDRFSEAKYQGKLDPHDTEVFEVTDFEVLDSGPAIDYTDDCIRAD